MDPAKFERPIGEAGRWCREGRSQRQCKQHLCRALPFEFGALSNIFQPESTYFVQYLQFKFLEGRWLCNVSNLKGFSKFQLKCSTICCIRNLYIGKIKHFSYF